MMRVVATSLFLYQLLEYASLFESSELESERKMIKRIIGGDPTNINMQPWLVSIQINGSHICGGSILTKTMILTAAHCIDEYSPTSLSILAGTSRVDRGGSRHRVVKLTAHGNFTQDSFHGVNDVALVKVSPPFVYNRRVRRVRLAEKNRVVHAGTRATVAGWGHMTAEGGELSPRLMSTSLIIVDGDKCARDYEDSTGKWVNSRQQICASAPGHDTCEGDSGGPLMVKGVQVGVTSWSWGCNRPEYPGVYANVAAYHDWIVANAPNALFAVSRKRQPTRSPRSI